MGKSAGQLKFGSVGPYSLAYEKDEHAGIIQQICSSMMAAENWINQNRPADAIPFLNQAESLYGSLTQDAGYRACCEQLNNTRYNPVKAEADRRLRLAQQQSQQAERNAAFSQGIQALTSGTQAQADAARARSQAYQPIMYQPPASDSNLMLILGVGGGVFALLLLVLLLKR